MKRLVLSFGLFTSLVLKAISPTDRFIATVAAKLGSGSEEEISEMITDLRTIDYADSEWLPFIDKLVAVVGPATVSPIEEDEKKRIHFAKASQIDLASFLTRTLHRNWEGVTERTVNLLDSILDTSVRVGAPSLHHFNYDLWIEAVEILDALKPNDPRAVQVLVRAMLMGVPGDGHVLGTGRSVVQFEARCSTFVTLAHVVKAHPKAIDFIGPDELTHLYGVLESDVLDAVIRFSHRYVMVEGRQEYLVRLSEFYAATLSSSWINEVDEDTLSPRLIAALITGRRLLITQTLDSFFYSCREEMLSAKSPPPKKFKWLK